MAETGVVLLVEDDRNILRANRRILESEGFAVLCAETLAEARRHLTVSAPDAMVLDILLPDGNGLDFIDEIRRASSAVPVLLLSALNEREDVLAGIRAGGDDYMTKPYDLAEWNHSDPCDRDGRR